MPQTSFLSPRKKGTPEGGPSISVSNQNPASSPPTEPSLSRLERTTGSHRPDLTRTIHTVGKQSLSISYDAPPRYIPKFMSPIRELKTLELKSPIRFKSRAIRLAFTEKTHVIGGPSVMQMSRKDTGFVSLSLKTGNLQRNLESKRTSPTQTRSYSSHTASPEYHKRLFENPAPYEVFPDTCPSGPPPGGPPFDVDLPRLKSEFYRRIGPYHPDRYRLEAEENQQAALQASQVINNAYNILRDPLKRAHWLLSTRGMDPSKDENAKLSAEAGGKEEENELLSIAMEAEEAIDDLPRVPLDSTPDRLPREQKQQTLEAIIRILEANSARVEETRTKMKNAFESDDWTAAKDHAIRLKYWLNVDQSIWQWDERIGKGEVQRAIG